MLLEVHVLLIIAGAEFNFWSGGYARDGVALLVCFALNSYHSVTTYKWYNNSTMIVENPYPLLYVERSGHYKCAMNSLDDIERMQDFTVLGMTLIGEFCVMLLLFCYLPCR